MFNASVRRLLEESLLEGQELGIVAAGDARLYACFAIGALKEALLEAGAASLTREEVVTALYTALSVGFLRTDPSVSKKRQAR